MKQASHFGDLARTRLTRLASVAQVSSVSYMLLGVSLR